MKDLARQLHDSAWKGIISEIGIGLEFSAGLLRKSGASKTIIGVNCDYAGIDKPHDMRAVSLEYAQFLAHCNYLNSKNNMPYDEPSHYRFGFAITGAHYTNKPSHVWMSIKTDNIEAYMHFTIKQPLSRKQAGYLIPEIAHWFLHSCLIDDSAWTLKLKSLDDIIYSVNIDVLYAPGISDAERLMLLSPTNALVYHKGQFHRVVDYLRQYKKIYPGSFNPPTETHLSLNVTDILFEISQNHCHKASISIEDMLHRIRMLDTEDKPTLITQSPMFVDKHDLIRTYIDKDDFISFIVGADTWNMIVATNQYPNHEWLKEKLIRTVFLIRNRDDIQIEENAVSKHLTRQVIKEEAVYGLDNKNQNSTLVRESDIPDEHPFLTAPVAKYIKQHNLYHA